MKFLVQRHGQPPLEVEGERLRIKIGLDHYELRDQQGSLVVRIEEHDGKLEQDLAMFPMGGNSVRLKGGLR